MEKVEALASSFVNDELVSIELEDGGRFKVQNAVLCGLSAYFRKALLGGFQETSSRKLRIPGCTTESFQLILYWICNNEIPELTIPPAVPDRTAEAQSVQLRLTKLWLTGDMLLMAHLQNETMKKLRSLIAMYAVSPDAVSLAFEYTPLDSPLRRALLEEVSRDFLSTTTAYSADEQDAFGSIPGFMQAFLNTGRRSVTDNDFLVKVPMTREEDSVFEVKPAEKDD